MMKRFAWPTLIVAGSSLLFACAGEKLDLNVRVRMDGQPAAQARVTVDNKEEGVTGADGSFSKTIRKKPGAEVDVVVTREMPGYRIKPWKSTFLVKLPKSGTPDLYEFEADLVAMRYVTVVATEQGAPVQDAVVKIGEKVAGKTDAHGECVVEFDSRDRPGARIDLAVAKPGYAAWRKSGSVEPGERIEAKLSKRVTVTVSALMDEYGQASGIAGVVVSINKKTVGTTDPKGIATYSYHGE